MAITLKTLRNKPKGNAYLHGANVGEKYKNKVEKKKRNAGQTSMKMGGSSTYFFVYLLLLLLLLLGFFAVAREKNRWL